MSDYSQWTDDELVDLYEERSAIMEHDGRLTRKDAERAAYWDWRRTVGYSIVVPVAIREMASRSMEAANG